MRAVLPLAIVLPRGAACDEVMVLLAPVPANDPAHLDTAPAAPPPATRHPTPAAPRASAAPVAPTLATAICGLSRSPPENAGDPPITPEISFGDIQHKAMKMTHAPAMSPALIAGACELATCVAALSQPLERFIPTPISRYNVINFTPIETAKPMYRST